MMEVIIIAAMSENRVIGINNTLPWSIKEDMAHFKELTKGWPCIMGRKTWDSLPKKPLPGRLNIVITKFASITDYPEEVKIASSLPAAIDLCAGYEKIFICGGETIYRQALDFASKIELTLVHGNYEGDAFFPEIDPSCWKKTAETKFNNFSFITYRAIFPNSAY